MDWPVYHSLGGGTRCATCQSPSLPALQCRSSTTISAADRENGAKGRGRPFSLSSCRRERVFLSVLLDTPRHHSPPPPPSHHHRHNQRQPGQHSCHSHPRHDTWQLHLSLSEGHDLHNFFGRVGSNGGKATQFAQMGSDMARFGCMPFCATMIGSRHISSSSWCVTTVTSVTQPHRRRCATRCATSTLTATEGSDNVGQQHQRPPESETRNGVEGEEESSRSYGGKAAQVAQMGGGIINSSEDASGSRTGDEDGDGESSVQTRSMLAEGEAGIAKEEEGGIAEEEGKSNMSNSSRSRSSRMKIGAFQHLPRVSPSHEILGSALRKVKMVRPTKGLRNAAHRERNKAAKQLDLLTKELAIPLGVYVKGFPSAGQLHGFERALLELTLGDDVYESVVSRVNVLRKRILDLGKNYASLCAKSTAKREAETRRDEGLRRLEELFKTHMDDVERLKEVAKTLRGLPVVKPRVPTLCLVGAPNVGKSSLVRVLSSGKPEVCNYPFTTRGISMGHFFVGSRRHQVTDTPGLLCRPDAERNNMEKLTLAAIAYLPTAVLFVHDLTGQCGMSPSQQLLIYKELRERFPDRPWIDVISKEDLLRPTPSPPSPPSPFSPPPPPPPPALEVANEEGRVLADDGLAFSSSSSSSSSSASSSSTSSSSSSSSEISKAETDPPAGIPTPSSHLLTPLLVSDDERDSHKKVGGGDVSGEEEEKKGGGEHGCEFVSPPWPVEDVDRYICRGPVGAIRVSVATGEGITELEEKVQSLLSRRSLSRIEQGEGEGEGEGKQEGRIYGWHKDDFDDDDNDDDDDDSDDDDSDDEGLEEERGSGGGRGRRPQMHSETGKRGEEEFRYYPAWPGTNC